MDIFLNNVPQSIYHRSHLRNHYMLRCRNSCAQYLGNSAPIQRGYSLGGMALQNDVSNG
jgi:hypothetical protein